MTIAENNPDQAMIARRLGISRPTLRKHYRAELDLSYAIIKSEIVANLVTLARGTRADPSRGIKAIPPDLKAIIFYLSTHGWSETQKVETTGPDGRPIEQVVTYRWAEPEK